MGTLKRTAAIARKEFADLLRERSVVLALLVQFFVAAFSGFLSVGLEGLYHPEAGVHGSPTAVAYTGPGGFDTYLRASGDFLLVARSPADALGDFQAGRVGAVVEESYGNASGARTVTLLLPDAEIRTTILVTELKDLLRSYEHDLRLERQDRLGQEVVYVETRSNANTHYGFVYGVLLPLLAITPVFLAGAIVGDSVVEEIQTRTIHLIRASPATGTDFVLGKVLPPVLLAPLQLLLWCLLLAANGFHVAHLDLLLVLETALALFLAAMGVLIALLVQKEGQTQAAYTLVVLLLSALSLLRPRDPFNLVGRLGSGVHDPVGVASVGLYVAWALLLLSVVFEIARRKLRSDEFV